jgi:putative phosphoribosyl transferase
MDSTFANRRQAGKALASLLHRYQHRDDVRVLALPRGGVPVAFEVAKTLHAVLDILAVRKLGVPTQPELAMGAIASGGAFYLDERIVEYAGVSKRALDEVIARERLELERRETLYRGARPAANVNGCVAIVVDDGMATGATMKAAAMSLRDRCPVKIVAAVPVAPAEAAALMHAVVDEFVCVFKPQRFFGVGQFYEDFDQTGDEEVRALLESTRPS